MVLTIDDTYREKKLQGHEQESAEMQYAILFSEMQKDLKDIDVLTVNQWYEIIISIPDLDVSKTGIRATLEIIEDYTTDIELKNIINELRPKLSFVLITISSGRWS